MYLQYIDVMSLKAMNKILSLSLSLPPPPLPQGPGGGVLRRCKSEPSFEIILIIKQIFQKLYLFKSKWET